MKKQKAILDFVETEIGQIVCCWFLATVCGLY